MVVTVFLRNNWKKNFKKYILIKKDNGITLDFPHKNKLLENDKNPRF